ncbi:zinc finger protein 40 isoform X2 [Amblyraja radiata]|uniref:zinc finger protein 40 isoform X2 n=1 Tax=Amblyraja radiata TaxID=386614 RepID=UPI00140220CF|nr:zinc finger protein 40 isoform X2 [Amblyraja radiata]
MWSHLNPAYYDKIQEAQKELQVPETAQKRLQIADGTKKEFQEPRRKGKPNAAKGVKRKKVVAENVTKKIPKSFVKTLLKLSKDGQSAEAAFSVDGVPTAASPLNKEPLLDQNGGLEREGELGQEYCEDLNFAGEATVARAGKPLQRKILASQHSVESCNKSPNWKARQLDTDATLKLLVAEKPPSPIYEHPQHQIQRLSLLRKHWIIKTESKSCSANGSSPDASSAFDVLLKAMEPELKTLSKVKFPAADSGSRKSDFGIVSQEASGGASSVTAQTPSRPSACKSELAADPQYYSNAAQIVAKSGNRQQGAGQPTSHVHYQQARHVLHVKQEQQRATSPRFNGSPTHQQNQGKHHFQHTYNLTMTSLGQSQTTVMPYRLHQSQLLVNSNQHMAHNPPNSDHKGSSYKQLQLTSVLNSGVEQASNSLLKDQKPKKQGKYICEYCNRACAKPSVLQKHIRSHTGERPYPCVTCGFSFKTKSNLYKHKKSHAHAIKLGLVLRSGGSSTSVSQDSERGVSMQSDVEESCDSEADSTSEERYFDQKHCGEQDAAQVSSDVSYSEAAAAFPGDLSSSSKLGNKVGGYDSYESVAPHEGTESRVAAALPKVVVYPVNISPARADSPRVTGAAPEPVHPQQQVNPQAAKTEPTSAWASWTKQDPGGNGKRQVEMSPPEEDKAQSVTPHGQLQRQQATEQGKHHLSPRSLGSTDSGYFSRSESADQQMSPLSPFVKSLATIEGTFPCPPHSNQIMATVLQMNSISVEKLSKSTAPVRAQIATKMLEERISKLISDNEAVVDDKQLDSVKPRRTSLSRRGSIDSPKPYTFKDSFQFDLRPLHSGRRTSSSSDIPKSPFTPTDKSKQVFLLSVPPPFPSLDCLPITRSNSMPATPANFGVPANVTLAAHPLRGSQSFDDKIAGSFSDDVFIPGPQTPMHLVHPRTLVRQTAVEDPSTSEGQGFASTRSMDEGFQRSALAAGLLMPRSKSFEHGTRAQEKGRKPQGRGSMYECETCRNRYRKLENFENHKKFYCSELHGPKVKPMATKDSEQEAISRSMSPQLLHYRVVGAAGVLQQPPKMRKRKKIKSIGDDDEPPPSVGTGTSTVNKEPLSDRLSAAAVDASHRNKVTGSIPSTSVRAKTPPGERLQAGDKEHLPEDPVSFSNEIQTKPLPPPSQERELSRTSSGVSVIQHTNSLSRPSSFEHLESVDKSSPVPVQEKEALRETAQLSLFTSEKEDACSQPTCQPQPNPGISRAATCELSRSSSADCTSLQPSRLVRQHNIQVPEILVTEEPDQEQEAQGNEPAEKFHWPQRSETLSNLPTEKLPPKKKRIRLAEMEHSSGESSFDSTLSRSFSQDSNLSCSSLSASFDKEDLPRTESPSKLEALSKSPELALVSRSNTLGVPNAHYREMRRAASEQNNSMPSSTELTTGIRSKSFDCGIISTTISPSPEVSMEIISTVASEIFASGSVSLIERRRGPLLRQMSLSIGPDIPQPQVLASSLFHQNLTLQVAALPQLKRSLSNRLSPVSFLTSHHPLSYVTQVQHVVHPEPQSSVQEINANNQIQVKQPFVQTSSLAQRSETCCVAQGNLTVMPAKITADQQKLCSIISLPPGNERNTYAPKYQLQIVQSQSCKACVLPHVTTQSPVIPLSIPLALRSCAVTPNITTKSLEIISNLYLVPPVQHVHPGQVSTQLLPAAASLIRPIGIQCTQPTYNTAIRSTLPQILVTQDQTNQQALVICKFDDPLNSNAPEDYLEGQKNKIKLSAIAENCHSLIDSGTALKASGSKMASDCLLAQEPTGTSKRMLSPANSLDIAMEKHQKRVKDENGSASSGKVTQVPLQSTKSVEMNKLKKPMLVRQHCTTDQVESSLPAEQEGPLKNNLQILELNSSPIKPLHQLPALPLETLQSEGSTSSSGTVIQKSPRTAFSSPPQAITTLSKSVTNTQGDTSASSNDQMQLVNSQAQIEMRVSFPVTSTRDVQCATLSTLKTSTNFSWCYLKKCKPLHTQQLDKKLSAYSTWHISPHNPNPMGLPTKVILGLLNSKQKIKKMMYTQAKSTLLHSGILVSSSKWKADKSKALANRTVAISEHNSKDKYDNQGGDSDKDHAVIEPRRIKIFDGGFKSNEEYVYVRGRGRGKYICEECGIRCKKPSMLRKHIRTHTDLRPYHCNYCNFSFKTKGNLTKHMKSKTHSKKCMEIGVSAGPFDDQDTDDSGDKPRGGNECTYSDAEDSDGQDEEDYEVDDDDEDSQGEVGLSATPSVAASPQHSVQRNDQLGTLNAASASLMAHAVRTAEDCLRQAHHLDRLPGDAWLGQTARDTHWYGAEEETNIFPSAGGDLPNTGPKSTAETLGMRTVDDSKIFPSSITLPPQMVQERQLACSSPMSSAYRLDVEQQRQQQEVMGEELVHLFSHLPLHSQQQVKTPYSMVPVGGIQLVHAGLAAYSTFVPIQAGPVQLSIPAMSILHQTSGCQGSADAPGHAKPARVVETEMLLAQVNSTVEQSANTSDFQLAKASCAETLRPLDLVNLSTGSQVFPSGLSFKTVDLQVLATNPQARCSPGVQAHTPGVHIMNITLPPPVPALPAGAEAQTSSDKHCTQMDFTTSNRQAPVSLPLEASTHQMGRTQLSQVSHQTQACSQKTDPPSWKPNNPGAAPECGYRSTQLAAIHNKPSATALINSDLGHSRTDTQEVTRSPVHWTASPEKARGKSVGLARGAVQYSDVSSDDEDRLVIAT